MFEKGEFIIYGSVGVCKVINISTLNIQGVPKDRLYYVLDPLNQKGREIFTPVDNNKIIMRRLISKEEVDILISDIHNIAELTVENEKLREQIYKDCIKSCQCRQLLSLIKTIYSRKKDRMNRGKKLSLTDERYFKIAQENLHSELSLSLQVPRNEMEEYIKNQISIQN